MHCYILCDSKVLNHETRKGWLTNMNKMRHLTLDCHTSKLVDNEDIGKNLHDPGLERWLNHEEH